MERFFFHIEYGELSRDAEGTELANLAEARKAAVRFLGELLCDEGDQFWDKPNITITVEDVDGLVLWRIDTLGTASTAVDALQGRRR
jgi:hypothetical protein